MRFWAKTGTGEEYLSVDRHLDDVGAVALRLFDVAITEGQRAWIARGLGVDVDAARRVVSWIAASHDIGKLGPFQHQAAELSDRLGTSHLPGFLPGVAARHDLVSGVAVERFALADGADRQTAASLAAVVSGHHSVPRRVGGAERRRMVGLGTWAAHQDSTLRRRLGSVRFDEVAAPDDSVVLALAGLVCVSDWLASDASRFPVTVGVRPSSTDLAREATPEAVWAPPRVNTGRTFVDLFGFAPRAAQRAVIDALESTELPALLLLEERTGAGKTEAALWVVAEGLRRGGRGLYVGLPTRATAAQFHRRARAFLGEIWTGAAAAHVRLLHGGAMLAEDHPVPTGIGDQPLVDDEGGAAREWFHGARRGLLSPAAVGTIDQALLAVLAARFYPVRLFALAGKVVVVDEVHAYDTYTGTLVARLVEWLAALGSSVVLLSATLPAERRGELTAAYSRGLRRSGSDQLVAPESSNPPYPRLTVADAKGTRTIAFADDRPGRTVLLDGSAAADDPAAIAELVLAEVADGGCLAVVCSTVAAAQERYRRITEIVTDAELLLLHARLRPLEREPVEGRLLNALGPDGVRPERLVVVATQVIEQSLDLDFDVMVSDLAPVDLLIQRAGRVHRHVRRCRPTLHGSPRLVVLDTRHDPVTDVTRELPRAAGAVYVPAILARTRATLAKRETFSEPTDLDGLIATVYARELPPGLGNEDRARLAEWDRQAAQAAAEHRAWADENGIGSPGGEDRSWDRPRPPLADGDEPDATTHTAAVTRWSDRPSLSVVVLRADEARLAEGPLRADRVRDLLRRSVSLSDPRVTGRLRAEPDTFRPPTWRRHGALRHHHLVQIGATDLGIDWDPVLGVTL